MAVSELCINVNCYLVALKKPAMSMLLLIKPNFQDEGR